MYPCYDIVQFYVFINLLLKIFLPLCLFANTMLMDNDVVKNNNAAQKL
jgi:hypothetical protein